MKLVDVLALGVSTALTGAQSGSVVNPTADDLVFTLPAATVGRWFAFGQRGDGTHGPTVRPQPAEQIAWNYAALVAGRGLVLIGGVGGQPIGLWCVDAGVWVPAGSNSADAAPE